MDDQQWRESQMAHFSNDYMEKSLNEADILNIVELVQSLEENQCESLLILLVDVKAKIVEGGSVDWWLIDRQVRRIFEGSDKTV